METILCAAVGTESYQHELEACTVYGDHTVCSCRHNKSSSGLEDGVEKRENFTETIRTKLAGKIFKMLLFNSPT
jgi:hypothetical protein